ncbi:MAG TPA: DinB family protein [Dehalococcoidia bacterium]|nr:DinB family protein [Dehalococcoidia bacterium]
MATPDEVRAAIKVGREALVDAITGAADNWEKAPQEGDGEDAWSARQVAEHVIPAEVFFAGAVCKACGYAGPESPISGKPQFATAAEAQAALEQVVAAADSKIKYVSEEDLSHTHETMGSVESLMRMTAWHLLDHAMQMQTAASS